MEDQRCCNNRRAVCKDCGKAFVEEHLEVRKLEAIILDLKEQNEILLRQLQEFLEQPTARDYAERETAFVSHMG